MKGYSDSFKDESIRNVPEEVKKFFEVTTKKSLEDFKDEFYFLAQKHPNILFELMEGFDWESEIGISFIKNCRKINKECEKIISYIISGKWRSWDKKEMVKIAIDFYKKFCSIEEIIIKCRILVCKLWCGCYCHCLCCWPPIYCCPSTKISVFPKNGIDYEYVSARRLRFSGADVTESLHRSDEAVITISGVGSVSWDDLHDDLPMNKLPKHDINTKHDGILDVSKLPPKAVQYSDVANTLIQGRNLTDDGNKLDNIENGAQKNNISDLNANALTGSNFTNLHKHGKVCKGESLFLSSSLPTGWSISGDTLRYSFTKWDNISNNQLKVLINVYLENNHKPIVCEVIKDGNDEVRLDTANNNYEIQMKLYLDTIKYDKTNVQAPWTSSSTVHLDILVLIDS